ncbi:hypothetical protein L6452_17548 [Arctium lappa]|uniref:Uncharacterized protein n=1 Tax=Arctium lappa TaxID=4217 RepID=A0ACB9C3S1_ARCLA|nr:hypothetical protein L6452_17548 [Arctium lappa]
MLARETASAAVDTANSTTNTCSDLGSYCTAKLTCPLRFPNSLPVIFRLGDGRSESWMGKVSHQQEGRSGGIDMTLRKEWIKREKRQRVKREVEGVVLTRGLWSLTEEGSIVKDQRIPCSSRRHLLRKTPLGVGGHLSGGGYGTMLQKYGLSVDHVIDDQIVNVNDKILNRKTMGEDLFWVPKNAMKLVYKWQSVLPTIDDDLFIKLLLQSVMVNNSKTVGVAAAGSEKTVVVVSHGGIELKVMSDGVELVVI